MHNRGPSRQGLLIRSSRVRVRLIYSRVRLSIHSENYFSLSVMHGNRNDTFYLVGIIKKAMGEGSIHLDSPRKNARDLILEEPPPLLSCNDQHGIVTNTYITSQSNSSAQNVLYYYR